ncbi:MAG: electron transfer flavoprotein subunit beta [Clostridia bacterium]
MVCAKQVPESQNAGINQTTNTVIRSGVPLMFNPADEHALEAALQIRDQLCAEVSVITMGQKSAQSLLRYAAALGADKLYLVSDKLYAGSDTYATSLILSRAIKYIGGADLVICGRRAFDGETGHVGPQLSIRLEIPCITNVISIDDCTRTYIRCTRLTEEGSETVEFSLPAVITVCEGINHTRLPDILSLRKAQKIVAGEITNKNLALDIDVIGFGGSPTSVKRVTCLNFHRTHLPLETDIHKGASIIAEKLLTVLKEEGMQVLRDE